MPAPDSNHPDQLLQLFHTPDLPSIGPESRPEREPFSSLSSKLDRCLSQAKLTPSAQALLRAALLLWHDHLEESHRVSQQIHSPDGSYLHAVMHRREPDYNNAKYWLHRAGRHPVFPALATRAAALLKETDSALAGQLLPGGEWDPFAFVDACEEAAGSSGTRYRLLQQLQKLEFELLFDQFRRQGTEGR